MKIYSSVLKQEHWFNTIYHLTYLKLKVVSRDSVLAIDWLSGRAFAGQKVEDFQFDFTTYILDFDILRTYPLFNAGTIILHGSRECLQFVLAHELE